MPVSGDFNGRTTTEPDEKDENLSKWIPGDGTDSIDIIWWYNSDSATVDKDGRCF